MIKYIEEIEALVSLLDDPDSSVHVPVTERLIQLGEPAVKVLENTWELSEDSSLQQRIENVILLIQRGIIKKGMKDWADCRGDQLIYGAYLLAKSQYPDLEYVEIESKIELLKSEIWLDLNDHLTAMEKIRVINHFLFSVHNFNRSIRGVQSPQLFFINHVLDTHKGLPVSLAVIYAEIAARLELPVYCVDLPRNFLLCYHDPDYTEDPDGIMFYINPYTQGTILGRAEVEYFLEQQKIEKKPEYMRPCSNIETIERLTEGLRFAYAASRMDDKANFLEELIGLMKNSRMDQNP
ncbi:MAG: transglutaminase-like domain-containing protein [Bacteroidales bacterium]